MKKRGERIKGQVWIETVIYTLIGLAIIGVLLAIAKPKIESMKDKAIMDQSLDILNLIDYKINDIRHVPGNSRLVSVRLKKGNLIIDGEKNMIQFYFEKVNYEYSEPGLNVTLKGIKIVTEKGAKQYTVTMNLKYDNLNITWRKKTKRQILQPSPTPYELSFRNDGKIGDNINIDVSD